MQASSLLAGFILLDSGAHAAQIGNGSTQAGVLASTDVDSRTGNQIVSCSDITSPLQCHQSVESFGMSCRGWSGKSCLSTEATCRDIANEPTCAFARTMLGLACVGWGGSSCMDEDATCGDITLAKRCHEAEVRFGMSCSWDGEACKS
mmetsp:Transcript_50616/g.117534  ORF Transcript_50616/g.117534 Transcript_50616/m.117534 type:complete len:148 (+) Transcript_50616:105-548(+)